MMYLRDAIRDRGVLITMVIDIFNAAKVDHNSQGFILRTIDGRIRQNYMYKRIPHHCKQYVEGYIECQFDDIMKHYLEFYVCIDGVYTKASHVKYPDANITAEGQFRWTGTDLVYF